MCEPLDSSQEHHHPSKLMPIRYQSHNIEDLWFWAIYENICLLSCRVVDGPVPGDLGSGGGVVRASTYYVVGTRKEKMARLHSLCSLLSLD